MEGKDLRRDKETGRETGEMTGRERIYTRACTSTQHSPGGFNSSRRAEKKKKKRDGDELRGDHPDWGRCPAQKRKKSGSPPSLSMRLLGWPGRILVRKGKKETVGRGGAVILRKLVQVYESLGNMGPCRKN